MRKPLFFFLFLAVLAAQLPAQETSQTEAIRNLRKHVSYLASDQLEGRKTGEKGATFAAGYVANMFAGYKLKAPASSGSDGKAQKGFLQSFPYIIGNQPGANNSFKITDTKRLTEVKFKSEWAPLGYSPNADVELTNIVFTGFAIESAQLKYNDFNNLDVRGKAILAFAGKPDNDSPRSTFSLFTPHAKANLAKQKGASALILISREETFRDDKLAFAFDQTLGETAVPTIVISRQTAARILRTNEQGLQDEEARLNAKAKGGASDAAQSGISNDQMLITNLRIELDKKTVEGYNVVGILEGNDPVLKNEAIVIGAHYDHLGRGGNGSLAPNSTEIHNGADDNASGTSAMLELARQFSESKNNRRTLIFIGFGGEEEGLLGSKAYVNKPVFPIDKTIAMINMDMVGRLTANKLTVGGIGTATEMKALVESENIRKLPRPVKVTVSESDQKMRANIEAAMDKNNFNGVYVEVETGAVILGGVVKKGEVEKALSVAREIAGDGKKLENFLAESSNETIVAKRISVADKPKDEDKKAVVPTLFELQLNQDGFGPSDHSSFYGKKIPVLFFFTGTHTDYHKPSDTAEKINFSGLADITGFVSDLVKKIDYASKRPTYAEAKSSGMQGGRQGFGVSLGTIPSYADGNNDGLVLDGVRGDSPASKAGIKPGDKMIKLAGKEIRNISDYVFILGDMKADEEYEVVIMRGDQKWTLRITPKKR